MPAVAASAVDLLVIATSLVAAWQVRVNFDLFADLDKAGVIGRHASVPIALAWLACLALAGAYNSTDMGAGTMEYKSVIQGTLLTAGLIGVGAFLLDYPLSQGFFLVTFLVGLPLIPLARYVLRHRIHKLHRSGVLLQSVVLVGDPQQVDEIARVMRRETWLGYDLLGAIVPPMDEVVETPGGLSVLGSTNRTEALVHEWEPDLVFFVGGAVNSAQEMRRLAWALEESGARIMVLPSLTEVAGDRIRIRPAAGLPMLELEGPASRTTTRVLKRWFDVIGATAILVLASPIFLATALAIKLHDNGPVFYRQIRSGRDGVLFGCYKFRSMVVDAEAKLAQVANQHGGDHVLFKAKNDPRITGPGRFLRRFSIDELPQLLNVIQGSMSLVGPRPPLPSEVAKYSSDAYRRLAVRPGMTGLWQVSGRSDLSWDDTVRLDLFYVDNWSMLRDLAILLRTAQAVVGSRGAY